MPKDYDFTVNSVKYFYECQFHNYLKSKQSLLFKKNYLYDTIFFSRLDPRDGVCLQKKEVLRLSWSHLKNQNENFYFIGCV